MDSQSNPSEAEAPARRGRWRRIICRSLTALVGAVALAVAGLLLIPFGQRVDGAFRPVAGKPRYTAVHPRICFDEGHYNAHTAAGRYRPLVRLVRADGYAVTRHRGRFTRRSLAGCDVLVTANAAGGDRFKIGPINLPVKRGGERGDPAFQAKEIGLVRQWVLGGGNLLLIADHAPFGEASKGLAAAFGVGMVGGFVEVPRGGPADGGRGRGLVSAENGLLADHPINSGLRKVMTFTGQSLTGAGDAILKLPADAVEYVPPGPVLRPVSAAHHRQAVALSAGKGRVVVLGEAGMISAQIDDSGEKMGMNAPGNDNQAFALNLFHWLSRAI